MKGFFQSSTLIAKAPPSLLPQCGACGLHKLCKSPKMKVAGKGERGILIVGEAPGADEDEEGIPFVGRAGQYLQGVLRELEVDLLQDCWVTNALICRPPGNKITNKRAVDYCRPNLMTAVRALKPHTIILLGGTAVQSLIGGVWKEAPGAITRWVGWRIPCQDPNVWICPTYHPSYLLREKNNGVLERVFKEHLRQALKQRTVPWDVVPQWEQEVEVILDPNQAAKVLRKMRQRGGALAGDYEGNTLQPETPGAEIVCCSMCWRGVKTIAYPWHGEAIVATQELWHADNCWFIASNMKHEDRWTRKRFGKGVRHWLWDTMLAAHVLNNNKGVCGLKFQAFVLLGAESYDDHIRQFLRGQGDKKINRIQDEVDLRQLLLYCGMDTLLEYKAAERQMAAMGLDPLLTIEANDEADLAQRV